MADLVATLGPASRDAAAALAAAGATAFRVNASHLGPDELGAWLARARRDAPAVPVIVDLQGAKMRWGELEPRDIAAGERLVFTLAAVDVGCGTVRLPHAELFEAARPGDRLDADDGRLAFAVEERTAARLVTRALGPGRLAPRKGIALAGRPVELRGLTAADRARVAAALPHAPAAFALSFITDGHEAAWLRDAAPGVAVIGKIERRAALDALEPLAARVDALWLCRGDLGVQLGLAGLARAVAAFEPRRLKVPVLMAGQVLEHLTAHDTPTRSEVCHLHDLLARGYAGIVLSDETALGGDPVGATAAAAALLRALITS